MADVVFVGVATQGSLVHRAMPLWQPLLPLRCGLRSIDLPLGTTDDAYRSLLDDLAGDPDVLGAVVTTHKVRLFEAGRSRFISLDPAALDCGEVNAIRRANDGLLGFARDPFSVGEVVDAIWPAIEGDVICLGAGGTARALAYHLARTRAPVHFVGADPEARALQALARVAGPGLVQHVGRGPWDMLVDAAPPGSLVVNATGMGKDRPGSPTTGEVRFPRGAVVWELNYRGELRFLERARAQAVGSMLRVFDGWSLFCHGWAAALAAVLDLDATTTRYLGDRFTEAAEPVRP